jgi:hypothetical protein
MIEFEFDEQKSRANLEKHGIDFIDAQALWSDSRLLEIPARTSDEARLMYIGRVEGRHWSAIVTPRAGKIRIISVRRSRPEEVAVYES